MSHYRRGLLSKSEEKQAESTFYFSPYLGEDAQYNEEEIFDALLNTGYNKNNFIIIKNFDNTKIAKLIYNNQIVARCVGRAEFGARALGNRSILANPENQNNVKIINDSIKNRDFGCPLTPSIFRGKQIFI